MTKLNLINHPLDRTSLNPEVFPFLKNYFNVIDWQPNIKYENAVYIGQLGYNKAWQEQIKNQGHKLIIENFAEQQVEENFPGLIQNPLWFWYSEHHGFAVQGYLDYVPCRTYDKLALIPMRIKRDHRSELVRVFGEDLLDHCHWSYQTRRLVPDDPYDRFFHPSWYNDTCFSIVVESQIHGPVFITEKTFKPIALQHPFMIYAQPGVLKLLHETGFETFENLFDESYDLETNHSKRLNIIRNNVLNYTPGPLDSLTLKKIQHNYNLFWNKELVQQRFISEIISPILNYE